MARLFVGDGNRYALVYNQVGFICKRKLDCEVLCSGVRSSVDVTCALFLWRFRVDVTVTHVPTYSLPLPLEL